MVPVESDDTVPDLVPARMVNEFCYCPRLFHLEWVHAQFADNLETVDGRWQHRAVDEPGGAVPHPSEGEVRVARSVQQPTKGARHRPQFHLIPDVLNDLPDPPSVRGSRSGHPWTWPMRRWSGPACAGPLSVRCRGVFDVRRGSGGLEEEAGAVLRASAGEQPFVERVGHALPGEGPVQR